MNKTLVGIYGASGFGKEVLPLVKDNLKVRWPDKSYEIVFIDDSASVESEKTLNRHRVLSFEAFLGSRADNKYATIAIADSNIRKRIAQKIKENDVISLDVRASSVELLGNVSIDDGNILCSFVTLTSDIKIGKFFHANIYSYVAHDCVIGDFVTFAPRVMCNGNVHIHDYAYIGTGAIIKQGKPGKPTVIGKGAVVGMGAVVTKDVPDGEVWVGNPAKKLEKKN